LAILMLESELLGGEPEMEQVLDDDEEEESV
jgi:hypothetical protein